MRKVQTAPGSYSPDQIYAIANRLGFEQAIVTEAGVAKFLARSGVLLEIFTTRAPRRGPKRPGPNTSGPSAFPAVAAVARAERVPRARSVAAAPVVPVAISPRRVFQRPRCRPRAISWSVLVARAARLRRPTTPTAMAVPTAGPLNFACPVVVPMLQAGGGYGAATGGTATGGTGGFTGDGGWPDILGQHRAPAGPMPTVPAAAVSPRPRLLVPRVAAAAVAGSTRPMPRRSAVAAGR